MRRFNIGDVLICTVFMLGLEMAYRFIGFIGLVILMIVIIITD